jgi:hypothetical protein
LRAQIKRRRRISKIKILGVSGASFQLASVPQAFGWQLGDMGERQLEKSAAQSQAGGSRHYGSTTFAGVELAFVPPV